MRRVFPVQMLLSAAWLLLLGSACERMPQPGEDVPQVPVLLNLETKAGGNHYVGTFRVALFDADAKFTGMTGSYCSLSAGQQWWSHPWLPPCRVDETGQALDGTQPDGTVVTNLGDADHNSKYGLRWKTSSANAAPVNVSLVAVAPAVQIIADGEQNINAYLTWTPDAECYISDPKQGTFTGTWVNGEYVYTSNTSLSASMVDHRASVTVRIACGELMEAYIQSVTLTNHITSARYYLMAKDPYAKGFSWADGHFTTAPSVLYDCGAGAPDHLVRADGDYREYSKIYLPAVNFSDSALSSVRPAFDILLGEDKTKPYEVRVVLNQDLHAMTHYTLNLLIDSDAL